MKNKNPPAALFSIWLLVVLVWAFYRYLVKFPEVVDEIIFKPLVFVGPVVIYLWRKKQLNLINLGFRNKGTGKMLSWGIGIGLLLIFENIFLKYIQSQLRIPIISWSILLNIIISFATAISEEILYRGFLFERIWKASDNVWFTNFLVSTLFALGHVSYGLFYVHFDTSGAFINYLFLMWILGFSQGFVYGKTRSIFASILTHGLWNFSNTLL